jgi:hypothetical protein
MVALAEMKAVCGGVAEIAEADAHVPADRARDRDGDGDSKDGMHKAQRVEIAIAKEDHAGCNSPDECDDGEEGVGEMSDREEARRYCHGATLIGKDAKQPEQDEALQ